MAIERGSSTFGTTISCIIAVTNPRSIPQILVAESINEKTVLWNAKREACISRNAVEMAECVKPLFQACSEVLFIDPHFNPSKPEYLNTFEQFFLAMNGNARIRRIEYHLKESDEKPSREFFEENARRTFPVCSARS